MIRSGGSRARKDYLWNLWTSLSVNLVGMPFQIWCSTSLFWMRQGFWSPSCIRRHSTICGGPQVPFFMDRSGEFFHLFLCHTRQVLLIFWFLHFCIIRFPRRLSVYGDLSAWICTSLLVCLEQLWQRFWCTLCLVWRWVCRSASLTLATHYF